MYGDKAKKYKEYVRESNLKGCKPYSKKKFVKEFFTNKRSMECIVLETIYEATIDKTRRSTRMILGMTAHTPLPLNIPTKEKGYRAIYMRESRAGNIQNFHKWNRGLLDDEAKIFNYHDIYYINQMNKEWEIT